MPTVGGFVFDSSGAPVDREIRVYRRDTGALLGKTRSAGGVGGGDPHFDKVSLLLHCDGADGSATFTDSSTIPKTITASGNAKISTAQSKFGGASAFFDGNGDYLQAPAAADLFFVNDAFTLEFFCRRESSATQALVSKWKSGSDLRWEFQATASTLVFTGYWPSLGSVVGTYTLPISECVHIAVARSGTVLRIFADGVLVGSGTVGSFYDDTTFPLRIGAPLGEASRFFHGYIDDLRITKGVARYTADFTPPAARFPDIQGLETTLALGEYYFATNYTGEVQVVCLDDDSAPLENDLILRTFPV